MSPVLTGTITTNQSLQEWQIVFYIVIGFYVVGLIIFNIFGSGEAQPWTYKPDEANANPAGTSAKLVQKAS